MNDLEKDASGNYTTAALGQLAQETVSDPDGVGFFGAIGIHALGAHHLSFASTAIFVPGISAAEIASRRIDQKTTEATVGRLKPTTT